VLTWDNQYKNQKRRVLAMNNIINDIINNNRMAASQSSQDLTHIQNTCLIAEEISLGSISKLCAWEELPQDNSLFPKELSGNIMYGY
jgi:hypothetical protein